MFMERKNKKLLDEIRKIHPDLILVAGDMLVGKEDISWEVAAQFVEQLPEICPVYYGNGNHEQRMKEQQEELVNEMPMVEVSETARLIEALPYELTNAQMRSLAGNCIGYDRNKVMSRLDAGRCWDPARRSLQYWH